MISNSNTGGMTSLREDTIWQNEARCLPNMQWLKPNFGSSILPLSIPLYLAQSFPYPFPSISFSSSFFLPFFFLLRLLYTETSSLLCTTWPSARLAHPAPSPIPCSKKSLFIEALQQPPWNLAASASFLCYTRMREEEDLILEAKNDMRYLALP